MDKQGIASIGIGAMFGVLYSLAYVAFEQGFATGVGILLILVGVVGMLRSVQTWRRTGLPLATAAMAIAMASLIAAGSAIALGWDPRADPTVTLVLMAILGVIPGFLLFAESRRSRPKWRRWKEEGGIGTPLDYLTGRNIPYLRER